MSFKIEKINGAGDDKYTCGVFSKHVESGGTSGVLVCCVLLKSEGLEGIESPVTYLHDGFEADSKKMSEVEGGFLARLTEIGEIARGRFDRVGAEAHFTLAFFIAGAVYVVRSGDRIRINVYRVPKSFEIKFEKGSGRLNSDDLVLISTDKFIETFDSQVFARDRDIDFEDVIDGLATDISALEDQSEVGAIFVQVTGSSPRSAKNTDAGGEELEPKQEEKDKVEDVVQAVSAEQGVAGDEPVIARRPGFSFGTVISGAVSELRRLRVGDLGAIFRLRRSLIVIAAVIVVILCASGFMTVRDRLEVGKRAEFSTHLVEAQAKYSEAVGVLQLNREKARKLLVEADGDVDRALAILPEDQEAIGLKNSIADKLKETENLSTVSFDDFWDGGGRVVSISRGSGDFFVFGEDGVLGLGEEAEETEISDLGADGGGFVYDNTLFALSGGKVIKLNLQGVEQEIAEGSGALDMSVFLGNIYLLGADQILKFVPIADGYAQGANYLEQSVTFGAGSRLAIDGSVWITNGSSVLKYTRGVDDNFSISGISGIGELGEIYTNSDSEKVYVIDKTNSALLVIGKDGLWEKSYNSNEFSRATDLYVDEESGKMYIATGSKILRADL